MKPHKGRCEPDLRTPPNHQVCECKNTLGMQKVSPCLRELFVQSILMPSNKMFSGEQLPCLVGPAMCLISKEDMLSPFLESHFRASAFTGVISPEWGSILLSSAMA